MKEIKDMRRSLYKNIVKRQVERLAFTTLIQKQKGGKKGKGIDYKQLEITDYLLPECELSNKDKIELFHISSEMNDLPFNYGNKTICDKGCKEILNNKHFLYCPLSDNKKKK